MQHTRFDTMACPIARGLDRVGEWWSILILRDAFLGRTRFDQFQKSLGIAPNILSRRLRGLVAAELLEKVRYSERPPRDEYVLTAIGRDFRPVLRAMLSWGNRHFMPDGRRVVAGRAGGRPAGPAMRDGGRVKRMDHARPRVVHRPNPDTESRSQT